MKDIKIRENGANLFVHNTNLMQMKTAESLNYIVIFREAGDVGMADYFRGLTIPDVEASDLPWMRDFWEKELACNMAGGFVNAYGDTMCASDVSLGEDVAVELAVDQKVVQTVNAVVSVVTALNQRCAHAP